MTKQEIFDKAVIGLHSQNWQRCIDPNIVSFTSCVYNGPNNTHCAIGWVFAIDSFSEGSDAAALFIESCLPPIPNTNSVKFYLNLQACHDTALDESEMQLKLRNFARRYKLLLPQVLKKRYSLKND